MVTTDPREHLPLKNDALYICLALVTRPMHGYAIMLDVEERSVGEVLLQTGALYRALRLMLNDRLIEECAPPPEEDANDERRRYYRLTTFGHRVLDAEIVRMSQLVRAARAAATGKRPRLA